MFRRFWSVLVVLVSLASGWVVLPAVAVAVVPGADPDAAPPSLSGSSSGGSGAMTVDERSAVGQAVTSGAEVEVVSEGTDRRRVFAAPDGRLRIEVSPVASRVKTPSGWVDKDARLRVSDGRARATALSAPVSFAADAGSALAQVSDGDRSLSLTWFGRLPVPSLDSEFAWYRDVAPGLDVVAQARDGAFSTFFVLKDAEAAARVAKQGIDLGLGLSAGLSPRLAAHHGGIEVVDAGGAVVFVLPQFMAWDQAHLRTSDPLAAVKVGMEERRVKVSASLPAGGLHLSPDPAWLTSPERVFPLVVDPTPLTVWNSHWMTFNNIGESAFYPADEAYVGYQGWGGSTPAVFRTMMNFDLGPFAGRQVTDAKLTMLQTHSPNWDCNISGFGPNVELWATDPVGSSVSWGSQPTWWNVQDSNGATRGYRDACSDIDQSWSVTGLVQWAAAVKASMVGVGLKSADESNRDGWRRYRVVPGSYPKLTVWYNTAPAWIYHKSSNNALYYDNNAPNGVYQWHTSGQIEASGQKEFHFWVAASDPDAGASLHAVAQVTDPSGAPHTYTGSVVASGGESRVVIPMPAIGYYMVDLMMVDEYGANTGSWVHNRVLFNDQPPAVPGLPPASLQVGVPGSITVSQVPAALPATIGATAVMFRVDGGAWSAPIDFTGCTMDKVYGTTTNGCVPKATFTFTPSGTVTSVEVRAKSGFGVWSTGATRMEYKAAAGPVTRLNRWSLDASLAATYPTPGPALASSGTPAFVANRGVSRSSGQLSYAAPTVVPAGSAFSVAAEFRFANATCAQVCEILAVEQGGGGKLSIGVKAVNGNLAYVLRSGQNGTWVDTNLASTPSALMKARLSLVYEPGPSQFYLIKDSGLPSARVSALGWDPANPVTKVTLPSGTDALFAGAYVRDLHVVQGAVTPEYVTPLFTGSAAEVTK